MILMKMGIRVKTDHNDENDGTGDNDDNDDGDGSDDNDDNHDDGGVGDGNDLFLFCIIV